MKSSAPPTYLKLEVSNLKNQYKILWNIVKKLFFIVHDANKNI